MDGTELCRIMQSDSRLSEIPIILLTAKGEVSDIVGWLDHGADDYITKPLNSQNSYLSNYKN
jgi:DNA-binding response OmpR family regulator